MRFAIRAGRQNLLPFHPGPNPAQGRSLPVTLQGLPGGWDQNHWSSSACTGQREGAESLGTEQKKGGLLALPHFRDGLKKGALTQGRRAAWIDPNCSGDMVLGRYSPFRLCREEGRRSGIMAQDKRETSARDLSGKKDESTETDLFKQVTAHKQ